MTDLVHNIGRPTHGWTKFYTRSMGFYARISMSRVLRWSAFDDKAAARHSVDALLEHQFDSLIVGHGDPVPAIGRESLATAMVWLPATHAPLAAKAPRPAWFTPKPCG